MSYDQAAADWQREADDLRAELAAVRVRAEQAEQERDEARERLSYFETLEHLDAKAKAAGIDLMSQDWLTNLHDQAHRQQQSKAWRIVDTLVHHVDQLTLDRDAERVRADTAEAEAERVKAVLRDRREVPVGHKREALYRQANSHRHSPAWRRVWALLRLLDDSEADNARLRGVLQHPEMQSHVEDLKRLHQNDHNPRQSAHGARCDYCGRDWPCPAIELARAVSDATGNPTEETCGDKVRLFNNIRPMVCRLPAGHTGFHRSSGGGSWSGSSSDGATGKEGGND